MALGDNLGFWGLIVGLFGIAAFYLWPTRKWIGYLSLIAAFGLFCVWAALEIKDYRAPKTVLVPPSVPVITPPPDAGKKPTPRPQPKPQANNQPPTMATLFAQDFPTALKYTNDITNKWGDDGTSIFLKQQIYVDFDARIKFVGFYIPSSGRHPEGTYVVAKSLVNEVDGAFINMNKNVLMQGGLRDDEREDARDLPFSGRVVLYHEDSLSIPQKADIIQLYTAKHYNVQFRGPDYLMDQVIAWHHIHDKK